VQKSAVIKFFVFCFLFLSFIVFEFYYLRKAGFVIDSDEAITGLMAKHILEGRSIPVFYYGQHYIGPFEALVTSFFFKIFGVSAETLKLAAFCQGVIGVGLATFVLYKTFGFTVAFIFSLLTLFNGHFWLEWIAKARGNYTAILLMQGVALLLLKCSSSGVLNGVFAGFCWWSNPQTTVFVVPLSFFQFLKSVNKFVFLRLYTFGFVAVLTPVLIVNLSGNFETFRSLQKLEFSSVGDRLVNFFSEAFPILMGVSRIWQKGSWDVELFFLIAFSVLLLLTRFRIFSSLQVYYLAFFASQVALGILLFVISEFGKLSSEPRYLFSILVPIHALVACAFQGRFTLGLLTSGFLILARASTVYIDGELKPSGPYLIAPGARAPRSYEQIIKRLTELNISALKAPYWLAYTLAFESKESIQVGVVREPFIERLKYFDRRSSAIPILDHLVTLNYWTDAFELAGMNIDKDFITQDFLLLRPRPTENFNFIKPISLKPAERFEAFLAEKQAEVEFRLKAGENFILEANFADCVKGFYVCLGEYFYDFFPNVIAVRNGENEQVAKASWTTLLKSSGCLNFLFNFQTNKFAIYTISNNSGYVIKIKDFKGINCNLP